MGVEMLKKFFEEKNDNKYNKNIELLDNPENQIELRDFIEQYLCGGISEKISSVGKGTYKTGYRFGDRIVLKRTGASNNADAYDKKLLEKQKRSYIYREFGSSSILSGFLCKDKTSATGYSWFETQAFCPGDAIAITDGLGSDEKKLQEARKRNLEITKKRIALGRKYLSRFAHDAVNLTVAGAFNDVKGEHIYFSTEDDVENLRKSRPYKCEQTGCEIPTQDEYKAGYNFIDLTLESAYNVETKKELYRALDSVAQNEPKRVESAVESFFKRELFGLQSAQQGVWFDQAILNGLLLEQAKLEVIKNGLTIGNTQINTNFVKNIQPGSALSFDQLRVLSLFLNGNEQQRANSKDAFCRILNINPKINVGEFIDSSVDKKFFNEVFKGLENEHDMMVGKKEQKHQIEDNEIEDNVLVK